MSRSPNFRSVSRPSPRQTLTAEPLGTRILPAGVLAVGTEPGTQAIVRTYTDSDGNGTFDHLATTFSPFGNHTAGVRVAVGDFDGDGTGELVTATKGLGLVKVWDLNPDGSVSVLLETFSVFGPGFVGGLFVAAGDLNGDGKDELAVAQAGGAGLVGVFSDTNGNGLVGDNLTDQFNAFPASGGATVAFGDTNGVAGDELIVGRRAPGRAATVRILTDADGDRAVSDGPPVERFLAFNASYRGGVNVATGHVSDLGGAELIVGRATGRPAVRVYADSDEDGTVGDDRVFDVFLAHPGTTGGVRVASGDFGNGTGPGVIAAAGSGGRVRVFKDSTDANDLVSDNATTDSFPSFPGQVAGVNVAFWGTATGPTVPPTVPPPPPGPPGTTRTIVEANVPPIAVPILGAITSTITLGAGAGTIADLDINLEIDQGLLGGLLGGLSVTLTHAQTGTTLNLLANLNVLGTGLIIRLDDLGVTDILSAVPATVGGLLSGVFNCSGSGLLGIFNGLDAAGDWVLSVTNHSLLAPCVLQGWSLGYAH